MANRLSRRKLSRFYADKLVDGEKPKKLAMQLAAFLVESKRVKELQLIIDDIEYQLSLRGVVVANVTSAHELDLRTKNAIVGLIKQTCAAETIHLNEKVESDLVCGLKLEFAGSKLDTTIGRKLSTLKTNCKKI